METALEEVVAGGGELASDAARHLQEMVREIGAEIDRLATDAASADLGDEPWMDAALPDDDPFATLSGDEPSGDEPLAGGDDGHARFVRMSHDTVALRSAGAGDDHTAAADMAFDDAVPPELMDVFVVEAQDHLQTIARTLSTLQTTPGDRETLQELRRSVHTLKGAAGMVGYRTVSQLAHRMEDLLDALYEGQIAGSPETTTLLFASADSLHHLVSGDPDQGEHRSTLPSLYARFAALASLSAAGANGQASGVDDARAPAGADWGRGADRIGREDAPAARGGGDVARALGRRVEAASARRHKARQHVRVQVDRLDELINLVGELVINRSALQQYLSSVTRELQELGQSVTRLRLLWSTLETEYEIGTPMGRMGRWSAGAAAAEPSSRLGGHEAHGFDELEFDHYTETHMMSRQLSETVGDIDAV